ncbi:MAG: TonB-dependent receptor [Novosphingobium aromaticivorans]|nr:TonB-dependent receptor [Novosphingobium aromaticivorans]
MKKSIWVGLHATTSFSFGPLLAASMVAGGALLPGMAAAQDAASEGSNEAPAIVVTANHREQKLESVPYSISVVSSDQLSNAGITDLASLTQNLPGLSMYDAGARMAGATVPIIRGINATGEPTRGFRNFEQSPVGVYINNSPVEGYIQLDDIKQVEVLRGPQGTLYGAGSLGGALRLLPNAPEFGKLEGNVTGSIGTVSHASQPSYTMGGMLNIPLGDTLAFRGSVKYARDPGFIDAYGLMRRSEASVTASPLLANPADPVNSSGIYYNKKDWNWQTSLTTRAALAWQPVDKLKFELAFLHSFVKGDGGPLVNPDFAGGASPLDATEILPAGSKYSNFTRIDEPFTRNTNLISLDASYDAGFATLSSTTSIQTTTGHTLEDNTYDLAGIHDGAYLAYYAGIPANPRFVYDQEFNDHSHTFSQEVRLVSKGGPDKPIDFTLGAFYQHQTRTGAWTIAVPGSPERSVAQGCTSQGYAGAAPPECLVIANPQDINFQQIDTQRFTDFSVYGELTWHVTRKLQITGGLRHFSQWFTDAQSYVDYTFPTDIPATPHRSTAGKFIGKADVSYEYSPSHFIYALWSQGFRRGGANSVPLSGPFQESTRLATYSPDKTNNFEGGFKGHFANGMSYAIDGFYIKWSNPQIASSLPSGNLAVYNGVAASSKGFEAEVSGPLPLKGLTYSVSLAYADARLTAPFSYPANNGAGVIVDGLISGVVGQQLPGSPRFSAGANLQYTTSVAPGYRLTGTLNGNYRTSMAMGLASSLGATTVRRSSDYTVLNATLELHHAAWSATIYAKNLVNSQYILVPPTQMNEFENLTNQYTVNRPREIGLRVGYAF